MKTNQIVLYIAMASGLAIAVWILGRQIMRGRSAMLPIPVQSFFAFCTFFTMGIALIVTRVSLLVPFGLVLTALGLSIFLSERTAVRLSGPFALLLAYSLLSLIQNLRAETGLISPQPNLSIWLASIAVIIWFLGIVFAFGRWFSSRTKGNIEQQGQTKG